MVEDKAKALQELLEMIAKNPTLAERITITIKPGKVLQGTDEPENKYVGWCGRRKPPHWK